MSLLIKELTTEKHIEASSAQITVDIRELQQLPAGGSFNKKQGRAGVSAVKNKDGTIDISANCDSLTILITHYEKEVFRLSQENVSLKTNLKTKEVIELSRLQIFQLYGFRVTWGLIVLYLIYRKLKNKIQWLKK